MSIFNENGIRKLVLTKPLKAWLAFGKHKPTNAYVGSSQIYQKEHREMNLDAGTVMFACPGGVYFYIDGNLHSFDLRRNPTEHLFEKSYIDQSVILESLYKNGTIKLVGPDTGEFMPAYKKLTA